MTALVEEAPADDTLPPGRLIAYYGDDYTGAAAVMEVLTFAGLPTVLFLDRPTPERLAAFADYRAIGIAGIARSQSPAWMDRHLPGLFAALAAQQAAISHYKVCSTFDSAPQIGSIGRAIDLGWPIFGGAWSPLVVAAPALDRYQMFGHLFAAVGGQGFRLDRHPTMARHPVTPMAEADICRHLAAQTARPIGLVDFAAQKAGRGAAALAAARQAGAEVIAFDVLDEETLAETGRLIWQQRQQAPFAIGSQGLEYALVAHWRRVGLLPPAAPPPAAPPVDHLAVVSGSCSPVTAGQITAAEAVGFVALAADATQALDPRAWAGELDRLTHAALNLLDQGRDPLIHTVRGPDDPAVAALGRAIATAGADPAEVNQRIGQGLGQVLDRLITAARLPRGMIVGGDTSGHAAAALGVHALTALAPLAPGAPICRAYADRPDRPRLDMVFKGGQGGAADVFARARAGGG